MATVTLDLPAHVVRAFHQAAEQRGRSAEQEISRWLEAEAARRERARAALDRIEEIHGRHPSHDVEADWVVRSIREDRERVE